MKKVLLAIAGGMMALMATAQTKYESTAPVRDTITVMTYNLRFGERGSMQRIAREIIEADADFVALQEVDINTIRVISRGNSGVNIISELADRTNMFGFFGRTVDMWGGYYGVGILSKYPIVKMEKFDLSNPRNVEPRIVLCGTFELGEKRMVFAATHFDYIDPETIALQAREADAYIRKQGLPAIIAGDLNSEPGSEAINVLDASMKRLTNGQLTFPAWEPVKAIDFIYGYPAEDFKFLESHSPAPSADAPSDHLPVISTFVLEQGR